jgi:hypothetical protein
MMKCTGRPYLALKLLALCGLVAALPSGAFAAKIIVCSTCDPVPILLTQESQLDEVQPSATNSDVVVEYLNLTGTLIDDLVFSTQINAGLSDATLEADKAFTCDAPDGYFLSCAVTYNQNGTLTYYYYGVNPPDYQDLPGVVIFEDILGQGFGNTGIPELGLFSIELSGWTPSLTINGTQFYSGEPTMSNAYNAPVNVPEASAVLILLTELLLLAGVLYLFRRRLNWKRFEL